MRVTIRRLLLVLPVAPLAAALVAAAPALAAVAPPSDPEPPPLEIVLTVDQATVRTAPSAVVVVTGTLTCSEAVSEVFGAGTVSQVRGPRVSGAVSADFFTGAIRCSPTPTTWTATTEPAPRAFLPGKAAVLAGFGGCNSSCGDVVVTRTMRLRLLPHGG